jgi:hypothetical protein
MENKFTEKNIALIELINATMKEQIDSVVNGELESVSLVGTNIEDVLNYVNNVVPEEDMLEQEWLSTNGWDVDFWIYQSDYSGNPSKYIIDGSMYYGTISFGLNK